MITRSYARAVALLAVAFAGFASPSAALAQRPDSPKAGGTLAATFDYNNDADFSEPTVLRSLLDGNRVVGDGFTLPGAFTGGPAVTLGAGHGQWRFNQQTKTLIVRTFHTSPNDSGSSSIWVVTVATRPDANGRLQGSVLFASYASLSDFIAGAPPVQQLKAGASEVLMESL